MASSSSTGTAQPPQSQSQLAAPPDPTLVLFARGVIARLEVWPALRVAVEQNWGGPSSREKRRWLASEIVDAFDSGVAVVVDPCPSADSNPDAHTHTHTHTHAKNKNKDKDKNRRHGKETPDAEYVAMMLAQALEDEFDASFEDGSVEAVAVDVVALWGAGEDVVEEWERRAEAVRGKKVDVRVQEQEAGDDEDEDEWEDEESGDEDADADMDTDEVPQLMPADAAVGVQRPAKPKPIIDEDGFTLVQKGRR